MTQLYLVSIITNNWTYHFPVKNKPSDKEIEYLMDYYLENYDDINQVRVEYYPTFTVESLPRSITDYIEKQWSTKRSTKHNLKKLNELNKRIEKCVSDAQNKTN